MCYLVAAVANMYHVAREKASNLPPPSLSGRRDDMAAPLTSSTGVEMTFNNPINPESGGATPSAAATPASDRSLRVRQSGGSARVGEWA